MGEIRRHTSVAVKPKPMSSPLSHDVVMDFRGMSSKSVKISSHYDKYL